MTAFVPYFGEDVENKEMIDRLDPNGPAYQSYLVSYHSPSGYMKQHVIEPLIGEAVRFKRTRQGLGYGDFPEELREETYDLSVTVNNHTFVMNGLKFAETAIHAKSYGNRGKIAELFGGNTYNRDFVTLNPGNAALSNDLRLADLSPMDQVTIVMSVQRKTVVEFSGRLLSAQSRWDKVFGGGRALARPFQWFQRYKYDKVDVSNLKLLRGTDMNGNSVVLALFQPRSAKFAHLHDLELKVSTQILLPTMSMSAPVCNEPVKQTFQLDASNVDHMTGLIAAMEEQIADGHLKEFQNTFEMLKEHRERLENDPEYETNLEINAAVHQVTNAMWKNINSGMFASTDYSYAHKHRNDTVEKFKSEVNGLINQLPNSTGKKRWKIKRRLRGIEKAIQDRMRKMERKKNNNTPEYEKLNQLNVMASEALTTSAQ